MTAIKLGAVLSRVARSMAYLVSKSGVFGLFLRTIVGLYSRRFQSTLLFLHND